MGVAAKNILIGIFVIIAIAIVIFILLFLHPKVGDNAKTLKVRFTNIEKITVGTRVTYAGNPVGEVISIRELPDARTERRAHNGDVYVYELILSVDSGVSVYNTDTISTYTSGLLGERGIEINPEPLQHGEKLILVEKDILYAIPARSLEETLQQFDQVATKIHKVLDNIDQTVDEIRKNEIIAETGKAVRNAREFAESLNQPDKWREIIDNAVSVSQNIKDQMPSIDDTVANFKSFSSKASDLMNHVTEGEGTVGRLLVRDELYLDLKALFRKADIVLDDMNNYGLLFQNNKKWQRMNAQRKNLLVRLSNPETFDNYFNDHLQKAQYSFGEVSMAINENANYSQNLGNNPNFKRNYGRFMRQVDDLNDDIKMYNIQVCDQILLPSN